MGIWISVKMLLEVSILEIDAPFLCPFVWEDLTSRSTNQFYN